MIPLSPTNQKNSSVGTCTLLAASALLTLLAAPGVVIAQSAENVADVINEASAKSPVRVKSRPASTTSGNEQCLIRT